MNKKYFFFDYDGTLAIPHTYDIPASAREALRQLEERGHFIALATGRLQCNAMEYVASTGMDNVVADGGNSVTVDGELIWMEPLELEPTKACLRRLDAAGVPWAVTTANELVRYSNNPRFAEIAGDYYLPTYLDPDLTIDGMTEIYKVYIPCAVEEREAFLASGILDGMPWVFYTSATIFIEPMNKARGIKMMMDHFGAPYEDVVVFGDGTNDVSMFLPEWTSIAMGNAREVLKERADYVTADCDDDGIAKALRHFGWI